MSMLIHLLVLSQSSTNCAQNNNMALDKNGNCVCKPGYFGADGNTSLGCWTCSTKCHENAYCAFPGQCVCIVGYKGDGIYWCNYTGTMTFIKYVNPPAAFVKQDTYVNISFNTNKNSYSRATIVMFGNVSTICLIVDKGTVRCKVPKHEIGIVKVALSIDGRYWSREYATFEYLPEIPKLSGHVVISMVFFISLIVVVIIIAYKSTHQSVVIVPKALV